LELHVLIDRKLRGRARGVVTGTDSDHTKTTGTGLDLVGIRRTLSDNGNVVSRDQFLEGDVFSFAGKAPALGRGDTDQIAPYAGDVDGGLRVFAPAGAEELCSCLE